jgi:signal transduction histidine kinase
VDDTCTLIIEDSWEWFHGIGMDQIFEKHARWDYKTSGLGLGLYLCRQIIGSHHGTIRASSSEKYWGAKFEITLPLKTSKN